MRLSSRPFVVLWLMNQAGSLWWLWTWVVWVAFQMLVLVLYPSFIAPLCVHQLAASRTA